MDAAGRGGGVVALAVPGLAWELLAVAVMAAALVGTIAAAFGRRRGGGRRRRGGYRVRVGPGAPLLLLLAFTRRMDSVVVAVASLVVLAALFANARA
ncbi:hypothetical protein [Actinomadura terrae]|uniref:hypothetical protein n=1 Tax=Actinomadura terrae TaxID=604353 RepID=UPI001FA80282|nr:hypothetical protein [Actinomadura terrae]